MSFAYSIPSPGVTGPNAVEAPEQAGAPATVEDAVDDGDRISPVPTPAARADVEAAARRYEELRQSGRELRFRVEGGGQIVVDVCDLEGRVLRTVPPVEALGILSGESAP